MKRLVEKTKAWVQEYFSDFAAPVPKSCDCLRSIFTEAMPSCPVCEQHFEGHQYKRLASNPLNKDKKERYLAMMKAVNSHAWEELNSFQDWEGTSANAEVYLFRCPDIRYNLAVIYTPYALEDIVWLIRHEQIQSESLPAHTEPWRTVRSQRIGRPELK